jgi:topoisomerase-4 subunit A
VQKSRLIEQLADLLNEKKAPLLADVRDESTEDVRKKYGPETPLGRRRTSFEAPPDVDLEAAQSLIEREPLTVIVSQKGWIRALKGHIQDLGAVAFKGDDAMKTSFFAETTSKVLALTSDGKVYTLDPTKFPGGRSMGEPMRLMADIDESAQIVAIWAHGVADKMLIASSDGRGFVVPQDDLLSSTRKGRQVMGIDAPATCVLIVPAIGDHVAVIGENRKLLVFPLSQTPEMARGKGVRLQRYKDGGLSDIRVFALDEGLTWRDSAGRNFTVAKDELKDWIANRAESGRLPPKGFPKTNKFEG